MKTTLSTDCAGTRRVGPFYSQGWLALLYLIGTVMLGLLLRVIATPISTDFVHAVARYPRVGRNGTPYERLLAGVSNGAGPTDQAFLPIVLLAPFHYTIQPGNPTYLSNFLNNQGCNWFGFVGRAFDRDINPVLGLTVHLEGGSLSEDALTGSGSAALGPGGYQFQVSDHPIATSDTYSLQLLDSAARPISKVYVIPTFAECTKNMVFVDFVQNW